MSGKQKCKMLKEIRKRIADANDIPYVIEECPHKGECKGTCPRCESEVRYLEKQLSERASLGKRVALTALCAGMVLTAAGCEAQDLMQDGEYTTSATTEKTTAVTQQVDVPGGLRLVDGEIGFEDEYYEEDGVDNCEEDCEENEDGNNDISDETDAE